MVRAEHRELGFEFPSTPDRIARLEEGVQILDLLMTHDNVDFDGHYFQLRYATYNPKPVQEPRPPLWIGAGGETYMLPLVARRADVWHGFGDLDTLKRRMAIIDKHAEAAGRDPASIGRSTTLPISEPMNEVSRLAERLNEMGFGYLMVSWPPEGDRRVTEVVEEVLARLRD